MIPHASWLRLSLLPLLLAGCATAPPPSSNPLADARQLVVVQTPGWDAPTGTLRRFERNGDGWREVGSGFPVTVGRAGSAWGLGLHPAQVDGPQKREGDGRSPAGVFTVGEAFGYAPTAATSLRYDAMDAGDYCVDVSGSPYYNRIVDSADVGAEAVKDSTEPMRRDLHADGDQRYRLGFVIEHNPQGAAMAGSCIFGHLWKTPDTATAGCTAMAPDSMQSLLRWLDAKAQPVFVLLPIDEYRKLQAAWQLPRLNLHRSPT